MVEVGLVAYAFLGEVARVVYVEDKRVLVYNPNRGFYWHPPEFLRPCNSSTPGSLIVWNGWYFGEPPKKSSRGKVIFDGIEWTILFSGDAAQGEYVIAKDGHVEVIKWTAIDDLTNSPATPDESGPDAHQPEYTGGSVSYYDVEIKRPTTSGKAPYVATCNDIIESLGMNYAEGNAFKAIWRRCAARQGKAKAGYDNGLYDAEKVVFFGQRMVEQSK